MGTVILKLKPSNEPNLPKHLAHAGIKGMRWGVRRYQNADGSLTDEGRKRYAKKQKEAGERAYNDAYGQAISKGKSIADATSDATTARTRAESATSYDHRDIDKAVEGDRTATETALRETGNAAKTAAGFVKNARVNVPKMDLSQMTDKEMRDAIARAKLEGEYDAMFNPERAKVESGKQRVAMVLDGLAAGTAIAGSALTVALMIKKLKSG